MQEGSGQGQHSHSPLCTVGRSSCVQELGEKQLASRSNYNLVFHPSPSLAEAASCANDIVPCSCFSQFFSGQVSICPPLALACPRCQGKGEKGKERSQAESKSKEAEVVAELAISQYKFLFTGKKTQDQGG